MDEFAISSYRRHYDSVYRFIRRRAASSQEAEDLTQEVFEAALAAFADQRLVAEPSLPWLYTVAERRLIGAWRRSLKTESRRNADLRPAHGYSRGGCAHSSHAPYEPPKTASRS
jgi:RNA polymerase sigma factor (sigma-70 family)